MGGAKNYGPFNKNILPHLTGVVFALLFGYQAIKQRLKKHEQSSKFGIALLN